VLGGLGSRGLSSAPLGAEIISAQLKGDPAPVPERLLAAVDPVRFALRRHQRRK
jgi:tRNA 5-methylaminomethyl-2-thiouridine biosynthesis bifunctional protein